MKKILTTILAGLFICFTVKAQIVSIPDVNFKAALIAAGVDKNKDGKIQESEALIVEKLDVAIKDISSLEGIAAFKHLTFLLCGSNHLRSIDLSNNTELIDLDCGDNNLTLLDISKLVNLGHLFCSINKLTALDVSHNKLTLLDCSYNQLTELDVSASKMFYSFNCSHNPSLTKIYIAAGITPDPRWEKDASAAWVNKSLPVAPVNTSTITKNKSLSIADVKFKAALIASGVDKNKDGIIQESEALAIDSLNFKNNTIYSLEGIAAFKNLTFLDCSFNYLDSLDVSNNLQLIDLSCEGNRIASLDISNLVKLNHLDCSFNKLTELDISSNETLSIFDCSPNPSLTKIYIATGMKPTSQWTKDEKAQWINKPGVIVPHNTDAITKGQSVSIPDANFKAALIAAGVDKNKDGMIQESEALEVKTIDVYGKSITSLNGIAAFKNLTTLYCMNNKLTDLDVSKNIKLTDLAFFSNNLTSIDLSKNEELSTLSCSHNQLTSLDVFNNTKLRHLICDNNPITFLDVSALSSLVSLDCGNNKFTSLDLSRNESLLKLDCTKSPLLTKIYIAPGITPGPDWKKDDTAQWIKK